MRGILFGLILSLPGICFAQESTGKDSPESVLGVENPGGRIGFYGCREVLNRLDNQFKNFESFPKVVIGVWLQGYITSRNAMILESDPLELSGLSIDWLYSEFNSKCAKMGNEMSIIIAKSIIKDIAQEQNKDIPAKQVFEYVYEKINDKGG